MPARFSDRERLLRSVKEESLLQTIKDAALLHGWLFQHSRDSRRADVGFPDCLMVKGETGPGRNDGRILALELKRVGKEPTEEQNRWLFALSTVPRVMACVVTVEDLDWVLAELAQGAPEEEARYE